MADSLKSKTDKILALSAFLTAIAALIVSFWQGIENRNHNRLSVKPQLTILPQNSTADPEIGLRLSNKGTGPALIINWDISVNNKPVGSLTEGWRNTLSQLPFINHPWVHYASVNVLQSGESRPILFIKMSEWLELEEYKKDDFKKALREIKIKIGYESIYHEIDEYNYDGSVFW